MTKVDVNCDFFILKLAREEIEKQFLGHFIKVRKEKKIVPCVGRNPLDFFIVVNLNDLGNNGTIWHHPIGTKNGSGGVGGIIACEHALTLVEVPM